RTGEGAALLQELPFEPARHIQQERSRRSRAIHRGALLLATVVRRRNFGKPRGGWNRRRAPTRTYSGRNWWLPPGTRPTFEPRSLRGVPRSTQSIPTRPFLTARRTSSACVLTPSLRCRLARWVSTVRLPICSRSPMAALVSPSATKVLP